MIHLIMIKGYNKYEKMSESLYGLYTLETLAERLKVDKVKAIYVIHRLRKLGLVKTTYGTGNKRLYNISLKNKQKRISYTEIINNSAPSPGLKLMEPSGAYYIYNRVRSKGLVFIGSFIWYLLNYLFYLNTGHLKSAFKLFFQKIGLW